MKIKYIRVVVMALFLSGCASLPKSNLTTVAPSNWETNKMLLASMQDFQLKGRFGVTHKNKGITGAINWQQSTPEDYKINFTGPMNIDNVKLYKNNKKVSLQSSDGELLIADTPEELLELKFGWALPIEGLKYWIKGIPTPNKKAKILFNEHGQIAKIRQNGWEVNYSKFKFLPNYVLPTRINLRYHSVKVKLLIQSWNTQ